MRKKRRLDWRIAGLVISGVLLVWIVAEILAAGKDAPPPPGQQPVVLGGGHVVGNRISTKSWTFVYRHAQLSADGTIATVDGLHDGVLYNKGKPYLGITAEHASVNTQTFDFTATGDVHIAELSPRDGVKRSFDTDLIDWANSSKTLTLAHPSIVQTGDQKLKIAKLTVDFNSGQVHFGKMNGGVNVPDEGTPP